jgi:putative ABC transport system permease protein
MGRLLRRLAFLFRQRQFEQDLAEKLEFHREMKARELEEQGLDSRTASRRAGRDLGSVVVAREESRRVWIWAWLEIVWQDVSYALGQMRLTPTFTLTAVITLALEIGLPTALFSVVFGVLLRLLPFNDSGRLLVLDTVNEGGRSDSGLSPPFQAPTMLGLEVPWAVQSFRAAAQ